MADIEALVLGHDCPQYSGVFVSQRNNRFLPATAFTQPLRPLGDRVVLVLAGQYGRLGTLNQKRTQVCVATFGDASQVSLATAGVLPGRQP